MIISLYDVTFHNPNLSFFSDGNFFETIPQKNCDGHKTQNFSMVIFDTISGDHTIQSSL